MCTVDCTQENSQFWRSLDTFYLGTGTRIPLALPTDLTLLVTGSSRLEWEGCGQNPRCSCNYMVYTWALKGELYPYFGVYVYTVRILGPFGEGGAFWPQTKTWNLTTAILKRTVVNTEPLAGSMLKSVPCTQSEKRDPNYDLRHIPESKTFGSSGC